MSTSIPSGAPPSGFRAPGRRPLDREAQRAHEHDVLTTAEASPRLGVFVDFVRAAGLARTLLGAGPFTVFAPTERAFLKLTVRERDALLADPLRLSQVMRRHVVEGRRLDLESGTTDRAACMNGETLSLHSTAGTWYVEDARVVQMNIPASNGIVHAVDSLLLDPTAGPPAFPPLTRSQDDA